MHNTQKGHKHNTIERDKKWQDLHITPVHDEALARRLNGAVRSSGLKMQIA